MGALLGALWRYSGLEVVCQACRRFVSVLSCFQFPGTPWHTRLAHESRHETSNTLSAEAAARGLRSVRLPTTALASSACHRHAVTLLCVSFPAALAVPQASGSVPAAPPPPRACRPPVSASAAAAQNPHSPVAPAARPLSAARTFQASHLSIRHGRKHTSRVCLLAETHKSHKKQPPCPQLCLDL